MNFIDRLIGKERGRKEELDSDAEHLKERVEEARKDAGRLTDGLREVFSEVERTTPEMRKDLVRWGFDSQKVSDMDDFEVMNSWRREHERREYERRG